uniref:Putative secreted protein n=1 Tax=Ixodes ricinus TaxID=34613 RepID=A0A147BIG3_IXORI
MTSKNVTLSLVAILAVSQRQSWMWQAPILPQITLQLDSPWMLWQPGVETPRRRWHSRSLVLFAGSSGTNWVATSDSVTLRLL